MNKLIIIAIIVAAVAASPREQFLAKGKEILNSNPCYKAQIAPAVLDLASNIKAYKSDNSFELLDVITSQIADIKINMDLCHINEVAEVAGADILEELGVGFLLLSNCSRDLGGVFLILDSIVQDPSDITNDIFALIFTGIIGYQAFNDCSTFINFLL
jgi:hypothetical protein